MRWLREGFSSTILMASALKRNRLSLWYILTVVSQPNTGPERLKVIIKLILFVVLPIQLTLGLQPKSEEDQALLNSIWLRTAPNTWERQCLAALKSSSTYNFTSGLVDQYGDHVPSLNEDTFGIDVSTCFEYCNTRRIPSTFNFQSFLASMTNYFLPFLTLCAQLPYETGNPGNNFMSLCLAIGSPTLISYSLCITIMNRFWIRKKFSRLRVTAQSQRVRDKFDGYEGRIKAAQYLLQEGQQAPLRASQEREWLSSLIVIQENSDWWDGLQTRLETTKRGVTYSFVTQMLFAATAYILTVIASFVASLGDPTTALQISSGSLWTWLIPVLGGWIHVGTQNKHSSIRRALSAERAWGAVEVTGQRGIEITLEEQRGLVVRRGLNPQPQRASTTNIDDESQEIELFARQEATDDDYVPMPLGVAGDEQLNASTIETAFGAMLRNVRRGSVYQPIKDRAAGRRDSASAVQPAPDDIPSTAEYCDLSRDILAYPKWKAIPLKIKLRIVYASALALILQWGTTGPSLLIAYLTPSVGLGCRSISYLVYGCLGTLVWLCHVLAMLLSHDAMLGYQAAYSAKTSLTFVSDHGSGQSIPYKRPWVHRLVCNASLVFKLLGKTLAVLNAGWLTASSLMEFTGTYDNCWCRGIYLVNGEQGYVVLFKGAADLAAAAKVAWGGGIALIIIVCLGIYIFFYFASRKIQY